MILDASPIIAFFENEPKAEIIEEILIDEDVLAMSTVDFCEVLMFLHGSPTGDPSAGLQKLREFGIPFVPPDVETTLVAAASRSRFSINLGDTFCYALAKLRNEPILTLDADFARTDVALAPINLAP